MFLDPGYVGTVALEMPPSDRTTWLQTAHSTYRLVVVLRLGTGGRRCRLPVLVERTVQPEIQVLDDGEDGRDEDGVSKSCTQRDGIPGLRYRCNDGVS